MTAWRMHLRRVLLPALLAIAATGLVAWGTQAAEGLGEGSGALGKRPLTVEDCVRLALQFNDQIGQAEAGVQVARGSFHSSLSVLLPSASVSADWSRSWRKGEQQVEMGGITARQRYEYDGYSGALSGFVRQNVLDLGRLFDLRRARKEIAASQADYVLTKAETVYLVRQQFYSLLAAIKLAQVEEEAVNLAREQLDRAEALYRVGAVARSDVLQAKVDFSQAEMEATNKRNQVRIERSRLGLYLGLDPEARIEIDTTLAVPDRDPDPDLQRWVDVAMEARPELRKARLDLEAARTALKAQWASLLPTASLQWSYSSSRTAEGKMLDDPVSLSDAWNLRLAINWALPTDGVAYGQIEAAKGRLQMAERAYERLRKEAVVEVRESLLAIGEQRKRLHSAQNALELARENLRLQKALYESGAGTLLEWDNARVDFKRAQVALIQAKTGLLLAHAQFQKAIGGVGAEGQAR